jgi:hypothetical protein
VGCAPGDSRPGPGGLCSMRPPPSRADLDADANYTALTPRPRLSPSFRCSPDCFGGSFAACPVAARRLARIASADRSTHARRLARNALADRSARARLLPDGSLVSLWSDRSPRFRRLPDDSLVSLRSDRSPRFRRLPDGSLISLRRIVRRVPGGCPTDSLLDDCFTVSIG